MTPTGNDFIYEETEDNFTVVLLSNDKYTIKIEPATVSQTELCGNLQYSIEATGGTSIDTSLFVDRAQNYQQFDLVANLDKWKDLTINIYAQNLYAKQQIVQSKIQWRRCTD